MTAPREFLSAAAEGSNGHGNGHGHGAATKENPAPGAGPFGMALFLVSLGVLFLGSLVCFAVIRSRAETWPPPGAPPLPPGLPASTALILAASASLEWARSMARRRRGLALRISLSLTLGFGVAFLVSQTIAWIRFVGGAQEGFATLYRWLFYFLTGLHAAHVVGGLVPLGVLLVNAYYDRWPPLRSNGLRYVAMYWHFLGGVWITLYAALTATR
jgi:cytochrome c oxidase subunit 3